MTYEFNTSVIEKTITNQDADGVGMPVEPETAVPGEEVVGDEESKEPEETPA